MAASSHGYVSFPHFTSHKRESVISSISNMCLNLRGSLPTFSRLKKCFSRSSKDIKTTQIDGASREDLIAQPSNDQDDDQDSDTSSSDDSSFADEEQASLHTFPPLTQSHSTRLVPKPSTRDQSPAASFRSATNRLRRGLTRRLTWRSEVSEPEEQQTDDSSGADEASYESQRASSSRDFIADLDALTLSQQDLELLRRMERVSRAASASPHRRRRLLREPSGYSSLYQNWGGDLVSGSNVGQPRLRLRGGGGDEFPFSPARTGARRRTTLSFETPKPPLSDDARPHPVHWWLAGGRKLPAPTYGELRVRKEVEVVNRSMVGFWGTVLGIRKVGKVGILPMGGNGGADDVPEDPVMAGVRGGSLKGSDVGSEAESVKSASTMSKAGSVRSAATGGVKSPEKGINGDGSEAGPKSVIDPTPDLEGGDAAAATAESAGHDKVQP